MIEDKMNTLTASPLLWIGFVILLVLLMIVVVVIHERDPEKKLYLQEHHSPKNK